LSNFLKETLIPAAIAKMQRSLAVVPVSGGLFARRSCESKWADWGICASLVEDQRCGDQDSETDPIIPESYFAQAEYCTQCFGDYCESKQSSCFTTEAGEGVDDTDYVLFVTATETEYCSEGVLAYALYCQTDQFDRPTMGHANFCPDEISDSDYDWENQLTVALHEITHALGFSASAWPYFRYPDGSACK
jgi:leishmanolysin-like peptidase